MSTNGNGEPNKLPSYPFTNVQVAPDGMMIQVFYSPTVSTNILLDAATCDNMTRVWIQQRKSGSGLPKIHVPDTGRLI